jgi:glyoxylase-like metal-dependent hydrolase (beta-lactamase superfamily II)
MFGGFLVAYNGQNLLIDCGTVTGADNLVARLKDLLGERPLDLVLLTHAHLDHAGGLSAIFGAWPEVKAVAHNKAISHLVNPTKLWQGTQKVMGELAAMYGRPEGVNPERLISHETFTQPGFKVLETPGHAPHHLSYGLGETMFCGEAVGCPYYWGSRFYSRPATPPRFYPDPTFASLEKLLKESPRAAYFAHTHEKGPLIEAILAYRRQLKLWDEILRSAFHGRSPSSDSEVLLTQLTDRLFQLDPELSPLLALDEETLKVEKYFMRNSAAGFLGYYAEKEATKQA